MKNKNENPLTPLRAIGLTRDEKDAMWDNITRMAKAEFHSGIRKRFRRRTALTKRWVPTGVLSAVAAVALVGYADPKLLNVGHTFNLLKNRLFSPTRITQAVSLGYGQKVQQTVTSHGITLTIGNIYVDPTKLEFDMVESFAQDTSTQPVIRDGDISLNINGTRKLTGFSGGDFQLVSGGKYAGVVFFPVMNDRPYTPLPKTFVLHVDIRSIGKVKGDWSFTIPVSQEKLAGSTKMIHTNGSVSHDGYDLKVTDVTLSPVQTIFKVTMQIPMGKRIPDTMDIVDNRGKVIGGGIENQVTQSQTRHGRTVQFVVTGDAPTPGATEVNITPMYTYTSPMIQLWGRYPKAIVVLPGLKAKVLGVQFQSSRMVVKMEINQNRYKQLTTFEGHHISGQFFLVARVGANGSESIGSRSVEFRNPSSNVAEITFQQVGSHKRWSIDDNSVEPQVRLSLSVPLR